MFSVSFLVISPSMLGLLVMYPFTDKWTQSLLLMLVIMFKLAWELADACRDTWIPFLYCGDMWTNDGVARLQVSKGLSNSTAVPRAVFDYWKRKVSIFNILLDFTQISRCGLNTKSDRCTDVLGSFLQETST